MHMTREVTKRVHAWYWDYIDHQIMGTSLLGNTCPKQLDATPLPVEQREPRLRIMLWDFNPTQKHCDNNVGEWIDFWRYLTQWCKADTAEKPRLTGIINQLIAG